MANTTKKAQPKGATATLIHADGSEQKLDVKEMHDQESQAEAPANAGNLPAVLTPQEQAKQEIKKFDVARNWIAKKKKEFAAIKIADENDKEGYKKMHAFWQEIRNKRIAVGKKKDEIKASYLIITNVIQTEHNELTGLLKEIEDPAGAELDRIDNIAKVAAAKLEQEAQDRLDARVKELIATGMAFNGSYYAIGETISIDVVALKAMAPEQYSSLFDKVKAENDKALQAAKDKADADEKERNRMAQQKLDQEAAQKKLDDAAADLKKQQDDLDKQKREMLEQRTKSRALQLEWLGMAFDYNVSTWKIQTKDHGKNWIDKKMVEELAPEAWDEDFKNRSAAIVGLKQLQAKTDLDAETLKKAEQAKADADKVAQDLKDARFKNREKLLFELFNMPVGVSLYNVAFKFNEIKPLSIKKDFMMDATDEDFNAEIDNLRTQWNEAIKLEKQLQDVADKKVEDDRKAALSDAQRVREWVNGWVEKAEKAPAITHADIYQAVQQFDEKVAQLVETLLDTLDSYEKE